MSRLMYQKSWMSLDTIWLVDVGGSELLFEVGPECVGFLLWGLGGRYLDLQRWRHRSMRGGPGEDGGEWRWRQGHLWRGPPPHCFYLSWQVGGALSPRPPLNTSVAASLSPFIVLRPLPPPPQSGVRWNPRPPHNQQWEVFYYLIRGVLCRKWAPCTSVAPQRTCLSCRAGLFITEEVVNVNAYLLGQSLNNVYYRSQILHRSMCGFQ